MKKPRNTSGLFALIMNGLGIIYLGMGLLVLTNRVSTSGVEGGTSSQLIIIGGIFLAVGLISWRKNKLREKRMSELNIYGEKVRGSVTDVSILKYMHWGMLSPYVVKYTFEYGGKTYKGKSELLWCVPKVYSGDVIEIYVDKQNHNMSKPIGIVEEESVSDR